MIQVIINGIFLLIPFVFAPWSSPVFEVPRIITLQRVIEVLALISIFNLRSLKHEKKDNSLIFYVSLFIVWITFSSIMGVDPIKSFWGNFYREDGVFTLYHLIALFAALSLFWKQIWIKYLKFSIATSATIISIWSVASFVISDGHPPTLSFGHPAFLAGYLIVTMPFLPSYGIALAVLALLSTKTMMGLVGIIIFSIIFLGKKIGWSRKKILTVALISSSVLAVVLFQFREKNRSVFDTRERIYSKALIASSKRPLVGWGWSNFDYAFDSTDYPIHFGSDLHVDKAHSVLLEILTTTGVVGFALYSMIIYQTFKRCLSNQLPFELFSALLLYFIISQTNVLTVATEVFFWMILGIIASASPAKRASGLR